MAILSRALTHLADLLWPPRCAACGVRFLASGDPGQLDNAFCPLCADAAIELGHPRCPRCALPYDGAGDDHRCPACEQSPPPFAGAHARFVYGGSAAEALTRFKYGRRASLSRPLGGLLGQLLDVCPPIDIVVPVPLHHRQLVSRGFNQSALLALALVSRSGARYLPDALRRLVDTAPQASLDRESRLENMKRAFVATRPLSGSPRALLVDDVITTTATARSAASQLISAGAGSVHVVALARTSDGPAVAAPRQTG